MKRVLALLVFALTVASVAFGPPAFADESSIVVTSTTAVEGGDEGLPGALSGAEALDALVIDDELAEVAARVDWTAAELTSTLLTDDTVYVTDNGRVGYADPAPPPVTGTPVGPRPAAHVDRSSVFTLHSRPAAALSIYLDFDGHVTTTTLFNTRGDSDPANDIAVIISTPFDRDGNPSSLSAAEVAEIEAVWQIVAEDYAPFNVDVTTEDPGELALRYSGTGDSEYGVRIVISPTDEWVGNKFGGVAYVGSFRSNIPAFVFSGILGNFKSVGDASSHEAGHALGLAHDGTAQSVYYSGHDAWGPIMGNSYSRELAQWSKGEYAGATNTEDDVAVLAATLGYREGDHGDTAAGATLLAGAGETSGLNVTAVGPDRGGYLTVFPCSATPPTTSTVNVAAPPRHCQLDHRDTHRRR